VNFSHPTTVASLEPGVQRVADNSSSPDDDVEQVSVWNFHKYIRRASSNRTIARRERDNERGYSINVKQVVLAFAVEFVIIGLILTSQYFYATNFANTSQSKTILAFLFPVALAVVELARVPLALAVRTQNKWYMQLTALFGVLCAVVVTSASLYQIGHYTFNPRLENVHIARGALEKAQQERGEYSAQKAAAQQFVQQKIDEWNALSGTLKALTAKYPTSALSQNCTTTETQSQDASETNSPKTTKKTTCTPDPAFKAYQKEVADIKAKLNEIQTAGQQALADVEKYDLRPYEENVRKAETEYRETIYQSQLHSYTGMLFGKEPARRHRRRGQNSRMVSNSNSVDSGRPFFNANCFDSSSQDSSKRT
jgi:hypothetical protein